ncbi:MAG: glycosyltransferase family 2 protein [Alphaproteobacteria bacterium]|nr:glycosyltransferase family 2 protein [Alphaproteobacteria bacterium]
MRRANAARLRRYRDTRAATSPLGNLFCEVAMKPSLPVRISTIIPCFNGAADLPGAVRSIIDQDVAEMEIIVVDDGSTDDSEEIARGLQAIHSQVVFLRQDNCGPASARNTGLRAARGEYVCFLDCDDEYAPEFFGPAIDALDKEPHIGALTCGIEFVGLSRPCEPEQYEVIVNSLPSNFIARRAVVEVIGGFPEHDAFRHSVAGEDAIFRLALRKWFVLAGTDGKFLRHTVRPTGHIHLFLDRSIVSDDGLSFRAYTEEESTGAIARAKRAYFQDIEERLRAGAIAR